MYQVHLLTIFLTAPVAEVVHEECSLRGTGGHGFDPGPRHTKLVKIVLVAHRLVLKLTG